MSVVNALKGLLADLLDRLADKVARTEQHQQATAEVINNYLIAPDGKGRQMAAHVIRGEVKNYLAELAEQAGVPFAGPAQFIGEIRDRALDDRGQAK